MSRRRREAVRGREAATRDGSGLRWPGASARFALFGEVLWVGVLCCVAGLGIVTIPAAFAAGSAHLHRFLRAEDSSLRHFAADFTAALRTGWLVGLGVVLGVALLLLDIVVAAARILPGWQFVLAMGVVLLVALLAALAGTTARWQDSRSWRTAGIQWVRDVRRDPAGVVWLAFAVGLTAIVAWQLPPLVVPGIGCLVFAALATSVRDRPTRS
ncbi:hypothetical protein ACX80U_01055 [Arthrobacter sp. TmT3-37]|uniref:DUF624 domain-containing protein n=1 Tax=Arthrobacter agilis TaxID=37921 RepID=A0A2L0UEP9_9MICC|nr:hypothetical protein [Arthrobacter agilis]AUZ87686.1 hypothetical protein CVO76_08635 [Arthrobacter agilis]